MIPELETELRRIVREEIAEVLGLSRAANRKAEAGVPLAPKKRGRKGRAPNERDYALVAAYQAGGTLYDVGRQFSVAPACVRSALQRLGVSARPPGKRVERGGDRFQEMLALWNEGMVMADIGRRCGVTSERVRQIFVKNGVDTRQRPLTAEQAAAVADYVGGASLDQASSRAGIAPGTLRKLIVRAGHKVRPGKAGAGRQPATVAAAERAAQMYQSGLKAREIATELGLAKPEMIYRLLAIAGVRPGRHRKAPQAAA